MFGTLRFILAFMVAMSHMEIFGGVNFGVCSVVVFYILSGYVMTHSFTNNFKGNLQNTGKFYLDRSIRLYPVYLFYLVLTVIFLLLTGFGNPIFKATHVIKNLLVIPLNYYMFTNINILQNPQTNFITPAWSLGAELQFYILVPLLMRFRPLKIIAIPISLCIFALSAFGVINTDYYGYRLLPGVLFIFLSGSLLYSGRQTDKNFLKIIYFLVLMILVTASFTSKIKESYTYEVAFGFLLGIVVVYILSSVKSEGRANSWDQLLGNLSYPLFLCHFLIIWITQYITTRYGIKLEQRGMVSLELMGSVILSYIGYRFIDSPVQFFRKKTQNNSTRRNKELVIHKKFRQSKPAG